MSSRNKKYYRIKTNDGIIYRSVVTGEILTDQLALSELSKLVIPPAYVDVVVYLHQDLSKRKILYTGIDKKGRKQVIYTTEWVSKANKAKFKTLLEFAMEYPSIYSKLNAFLHNKKNSKNKELSVLIFIILYCNFRIGHPRYEKMYNSYGILNIKKSHVTLLPGRKISITFSGKKAVINSCSVQVSQLIYNFFKKRLNTTDTDQYIFKTRYPQTVNNWLKEIHPLLTTKLFRTYSANVLLIEKLKELTADGASGRPGLSIKRQLVSAIKYVADSINNTPSVAKKNYINNNLINKYLNRTFVVNQYESSRTQLIKFLTKL